MQIFFGWEESLFGERTGMCCRAMDFEGAAFERIKSPRTRALLAIEGLDVHVGFLGDGEYLISIVFT